jgi:hypothetical protein
MADVQRKIGLRRRAGSAPQHGLDQDAARRTDALLRRLAAREWTILTDIDPRHGVDHVLVGPGGVFVIASRKPEGAGARVRDGVLWLRREGDTRADRPGVAINRQALDSARSMQREIRRRTGHGPAVHAVVVLWCEFPQGIAESSQITFLHGRDLSIWLSERPHRLDQPGRALVVQTLRAMHDSAANRAARTPHLPHIGPRHRAA